MFSARLALFALVLQFADVASYRQVKRQMNSLDVSGPKVYRAANLSDASLLASFIAENAYLTVESGAGLTARGKLTLSGTSVNELNVFTDRPFRHAGSVPASSFTNSFKATFSAASGGFPNAVIAGGTPPSGWLWWRRPGGPTQETIMLESATYEQDQVTFNWSSITDETIQDLELTSASLFIDGFGCVFWNPMGYMERELCKGIGGIISNAGASVACATVDLSAAGLCAVATAETGEILWTPCLAAVAFVCEQVIAYFSTQIIDEIRGGTKSIEGQCTAAGFGPAC